MSYQVGMPVREIAAVKAGLGVSLRAGPSKTTAVPPVSGMRRHVEGALSLTISPILPGGG
jgi:hypothetical protein